MESELLAEQKAMVRYHPNQSIIYVYKNTEARSYALSKYLSLIDVKGTIMRLYEYVDTSNDSEWLLCKYYKNIHGLWIKLDLFYATITHPYQDMIEIFVRADNITDITNQYVLQDLSVIPESLFLDNDDYLTMIGSKDGLSVNQIAEDSPYSNDKTVCTRFFCNDSNLLLERFSIRYNQISIDEYQNIDLRLTILDTTTANFNFLNSLILINGCEVDYVVDANNPKIAYVVYGTAMAIHKPLGSKNSGIPYYFAATNSYTLEITDPQWYYDFGIEVIKYNNVDIKKNTILDYRSKYLTFKMTSIKVVESIRLEQYLPIANNILVCRNGVFLTRDQYTVSVDENESVKRTRLTFTTLKEELATKGEELELSGDPDTPATLQDIENDKTYNVYYFTKKDLINDVELIYDKIDQQKDYPLINDVLVHDYNVNDVILNNGTFDMSVYKDNNYITIPPYDTFFKMNTWNTSKEMYEAIDYNRIANRIDFRRIRLLKTN